MEDHQNTVRLIVSGAFTRGMKNCSTDPHLEPCDKPVAVYHALPHGLKDSLRQPVAPHFFTDIGPVLARKRAMLACHASQKQWLDETQGMDAYLDEMERMSREVGRVSGQYEFAEGWRRHSHLGFGPEDFDPGYHDNPFGLRLTALMISKRIADSVVPMSLLADHPDVHFHYLRSGLGTVEVKFH